MNETAVDCALRMRRPFVFERIDRSRFGWFRVIGLMSFSCPWMVFVGSLVSSRRIVALPFGRAGDPASRLTGERLEKALKKAYVRREGCKGVLTEDSEGSDDHERPR